MYRFFCLHFCKLFKQKPELICLFHDLFLPVKSEKNENKQIFKKLCFISHAYIQKHILNAQDLRVKKNILFVLRNIAKKAFSFQELTDRPNYFGGTHKSAQNSFLTNKIFKYSYYSTQWHHALMENNT